MLRRLYDGTMALAGRRNAAWWMAGVAFVESSVFPIPPDVLLIPMILAVRARAWRLAALCTIASVAGGLGGYGIGFFLYESAGAPIIAFYGYENRFADLRLVYAEYGMWIVSVAGLTPFPYKLVTIASGVLALDPAVFALASIAGRGARFFLVAALLWKFGPAIRSFIERRLGLVAAVSAILLVGGFAVAGFL